MPAANKAEKKNAERIRTTSIIRFQGRRIPAATLECLGRLFLLLLAASAAYAGELRGVWVDRSSLASREEIRSTLQNLSNANFNAAFVDVWSRGYPLWPSKVFEGETGVLIDPMYAGRDPLQEMIDEAAPLGIAVIPWLQYGFVGGWSEYFPGDGKKGPIFDTHPDWLAKTKAGEVAFPISAGKYYWMVHTRPDVQNFLIQLTVELGGNYAVPSIQFDRARYPKTDCGYDDYTRELYASEHNGGAIPDDPDDPEWVSWRAAKLNSFLADLARQIKAADWRVLVTNAPIAYRYGYVKFAQEYPVWVKEGSVDYITPQLYFRDARQYGRELDRQMASVGDTSRLVPGVDISHSRDAQSLIQMIGITRAKGLAGVVVWYYRDLVSSGALDKLKASIFAEKVPFPFR